jgi:YD repeat-containing protein
VDSLAGAIVRAYDGLDDLTEEQTPQGAVTYTYDLAGRRLSMAAASQATVKYAWDNADRLTGITQGTTSVGFSYDAANRRTQLTLPNGVILAYTYDADSHAVTWSLGGVTSGSAARSAPTG